MAEILSTISFVSFIVACIGLVITIFIYFNYKISDVIGDLSGRNAKKSIAEMRKHNENSGDKTYKPSRINLERGKLTELQQQDDKKVLNRKNIISEDSVETELLNNNETELLSTANETEFLNTENETAALNESVTEELVVNSNRTTKKIEMLDEVIIIHSNKLI